MYAVIHTKSGGRYEVESCCETIEEFIDLYIERDDDYVLIGSSGLFSRYEIEAITFEM